MLLGASNCPRYVDIELLADKLAFNLPSFAVTKIVKKEDEWETFARKLAHENKWPVMASPIVWLELVDRGGKGTLIGGSQDFKEYVNCYYDQVSEFTSYDLLSKMEDNKRFKEMDIEYAASLIPTYPLPKKIVVIGAETPVASCLMMLLTLRKDTKAENKIKLHFFTEDENKFQELCELKAQVEDCACPVITEAVVEYSLSDALLNASMVVLLDVIPRLHYHRSESYQTADSFFAVLEPRESWLSRRYSFLHHLGGMIKNCCPSDVKVLVCGSSRFFDQAEIVAAPINFDVHALYVACRDKIPQRNIIGLARPLKWHLQSAIARKMGVRCCDLVDLIVFGNIEHRFHIDFSQTRVYRRHGKSDSIVGPNWFNLDAEPLLWDKHWLQEELLPVAMGKEKLPGKHKAALCHASAINSFIGQWHFGDVEREEMIESLVMISEGWYNVPKGVAFAFPITMNPSGCFSVLEDIPFDVEKQQALQLCIKDTLEDWAVINPVPLESYTSFLDRMNAVTLSPKPSEDVIADLSSTA